MTQILVYLPDGIETATFLDDVVENISNNIISEIDTTQVNRLNSQLKEFWDHRLPQSPRSKNHDLNTRDIIVGASKNIVWKKYKAEEYRILLDPNALIPGTLLRYETAMSLIDRGNLQVSPYTIWSDTMEHFSKKLPSLYSTYMKRNYNVNTPLR